MTSWWCLLGVGDCSGTVVGPYRSQRKAKRDAELLNADAKGDGWFEVRPLQRPEPVKTSLQTRKVRWFS